MTMLVVTTKWDLRGRSQTASCSWMKAVVKPMPENSSRIRTDDDCFSTNPALTPDADRHEFIRSSPASRAGRAHLS